MIEENIFHIRTANAIKKIETYKKYPVFCDIQKNIALCIYAYIYVILEKFDETGKKEPRKHNINSKDTSDFSNGINRRNAEK